MRLATQFQIYWLALLSQKPYPAVQQYQETSILQSKLPQYSLNCAPSAPVIGTFTWSDIREFATKGRSKMNYTEQAVAERLINYLDLKQIELTATSASDRSTAASTGQLTI